jgi:NAD(P)-dependent dehydrogenase (short-subunit alcohol dehydrogenase family)
VNAIGPGPTIKNVRQSSKNFEKSIKKTLLKIGSPPKEIARTVKFLLESNSITGQFIVVDGGEHLS